MTKEEAGALNWEPIRRPIPLFFQSFFAGGGLLTAWWFPDAIVFVICVSLVMLVLCRILQARLRWSIGGGLLLIFFIYGQQTYHQVAGDDLRYTNALLPRSVELKLIPLEEPAWKPGAYDEQKGHAVCRVLAINLGDGWRSASGEVWTSLKGDPKDNQYYGYEAIAGGYLEIPQPPQGPGQFDFSRYLKSSGINHQFSAHLEDWQPTGNFEGWRLLKWANDLRSYMLEVLQLGLDPQSPWPSLMAGMLFGYRDGISTEMMNEFSITGTLHLFAVSGQNVGMILCVFLIFLRSFGLIQWRWGWLVAPGLIMFCLSTGLESSASRALVMIVLVLIAWLAHRPVTPLNLLGAAALLLWVWDPWQMLDVGFQLSFLVLLALLVVTGGMARGLYLPLRPDVFIPRERLSRWRLQVDQICAKCCMLFAASFTAWLASLPLILYHFGLVSPITVLSNCLVVPLAGAVVVLALLAVISSVVWDPLAVCFNLINAKILMLMTAIISSLAAVPGGHFYISRDAAWGSDRFKMTVLAGERCAPVILETGERTVLIGAGSAREWKYNLDPARKYLGLESFDGLVVMQANQRYLGGLVELLETMSVTEIFMPPHPSLSPAYRKWVRYQQEVPRRVESVQAVAAGAVLWQDDTSRATIQWPAADDLSWSSENAGLSLLLELESVRFALVGNPSSRVEAVWAESIAAPNPQVLIQGMHSREPGLSFSWLKKLKPEIIVRPGSGFYPEQDLSMEKRNTLSQMQMQLIELENTGPIQIRGDGDSWRILYWNRENQRFVHEK